MKYHAAKARAGRLGRRLAVGAALAAACAACTAGQPDLLARPLDSGADAGTEAEAGPDAGAGDAAPDADPTLGGPCVDDGQCDDALACTFDSCDRALGRCRNVPDDSACDDGVYCDGRERCAPRRGCEAGPVVACDDGNSCTVDRCDEPTRACQHAPRDLDHDGNPDDRCVPRRDCDDLDPTIASTRSEVCANKIDDNCDGQVDESPCVSVAHDACADPLAITAPGTYALDTRGARRDYATSCGQDLEDVVASITIPPGKNQDIDVWAQTSAGAVLVSAERACGVSPSELACGTSLATNATRIRARDLAPGAYYAVIGTDREASVELSVDLHDPIPRATNEACANAAPLAPGATVTVSLIDPTKDLPSACAAGTGELTYAVTLPAAADVKVYASTAKGSGAPILGLRAAHCTDAADELRCAPAGPLPLFARALPAGAYVLTVAATAPIDATVTLETSPPTAPPPDETCASPPQAALNATSPFNLSSHDGRIHDGCATGGPEAAFDLALPSASDVLLVARFPDNEQGSLAFDAPSCASAARLACTSGPTPLRASKRGVPAGDYRVVVGDLLGESGSLTALVRPALAPVNLIGAASDRCDSVIDIPASGGYLTGDTSAGAAADFSASCDQAGTSGAGAPDQILRLVLSERRRVVFDMSGSVYTTLLDVRSGDACPGSEVSGACYVGYGGARSFLDLTLDAGTYWVQIDGLHGDAGAWALDVRVIDP